MRFVGGSAHCGRDFKGSKGPVFYSQSRLLRSRTLERVRYLQRLRAYFRRRLRYSKIFEARTVLKDWMTNANELPRPGGQSLYRARDVAVPLVRGLWEQAIQ